MAEENVQVPPSSPNAGEREFETGKDESWSASQHSQNEAWFANVKRSFDEYQHESLESIRTNRSYISKVLSDAQQYDNQRQAMANLALQNAVETANMVGKQGIESSNIACKQNVRHNDIAADRQWNVDEQGYQVSDILSDQNFKDAIQAAVSGAVTDALKTIKA